ncbi:DUF397 domain-containing protein [Streptomyces hirsutus]|uniref:DUF397 domain-containing protein n=1 Tax=Streptomyces hirsutus TaxID=35620 RepID=UPI0006E2906E|nr:DUF397 domain-containing protein [Streptomyces hirsutus]
MSPAQETGNDDVRWFTSSYSGGAGSDCVEVGFGGLVTSIRDSKAPRQGKLTVRTSAFAALVSDLKACADIRETG